MGIITKLPVEKETAKKVKLTFSDCLITQPLIYEVSKIYDVVTNIEKAEVTTTDGWVIMSVAGTGKEQDKALQWLADQGVMVQTMMAL